MLLVWVQRVLSRAKDKVGNKSMSTITQVGESLPDGVVVFFLQVETINPRLFSSKLFVGTPDLG